MMGYWFYKKVPVSVLVGNSHENICKQIDIAFHNFAASVLIFFHLNKVLKGREHLRNDLAFCEKNMLL
jgi:hypothetical protein